MNKTKERLQMYDRQLSDLCSRINKIDTRIGSTVECDKCGCLLKKTTAIKDRGRYGLGIFFIMLVGVSLGMGRRKSISTIPTTVRSVRRRQRRRLGEKNIK